MYTTWSPGLSRSISVVSAPSPDEKARQCFASSSAARHSSSALRVGLPVREYSKPWCLPTACCAKVVAMWMGWTTAPVAGSGPWPTCRARVAKPQLSPPPGGFAADLPSEWGGEEPRSVSSGKSSALAAVRDELEQVGARDHRHGPVALHHQHRLLAAQQGLERVVQRGVHADLAQRRVHRRGHRRGHDRRIAVHAVEQGALLERAHHPLPVRLL